MLCSLGRCRVAARSWWGTVFYFSVYANLCSGQATGTGDLVLVSTPQELQQALNPQNFTANVLVRDHLNMVSALEEGPLTISAFTKSIVGNCTEAGPAPAGFGLTEPLPPGACALFVEQDFIETNQKVTLWLSNLYVVVSPKVGDKESVLIYHTTGDMWVTSSVFQGAGTNGRAVYLTSEGDASPRMLMQGVLITGFTGPSAPGLLLGNDTTLTLQATAVNNMNLTMDPSGEDEVAAGSAIQAWSGAGILLEETVFINNTVHGAPAGSKAVALLGGDDSAVLYSLPTITAWHWGDNQELESDVVTLSGERGNGDQSQGFMQEISLTFLEQNQQALVDELFGVSEAPAAAPADAPAPAATYPTAATPPPAQPGTPAADPVTAAEPSVAAPQQDPTGDEDMPAIEGELLPEDLPPVDDGSGSDSQQVAYIVGASVGAALLVTLCGIVVLIMLLRRQRNRQHEAEANNGWAQHQASWPGSHPSAGSYGNLPGGPPPPGGPAAVELVAMARSRSKPSSDTKSRQGSRSGSVSSNGGLPYTSVTTPMLPTGSTHTMATGGMTTAGMSAGGMSSLNPTVGSVYPTRSAHSSTSGGNPDFGAVPETPAPDKLTRTPTPPRGQRGSSPLKPPLSGTTPSNLRPLPSGASSAASMGVQLGSVAIASLAAQSTNQHAAQRGESMLSMGIALPTSTRDFSSCGVAHGSHTLGTTFDSIPVDLPALPLPTTADRDAGSVMPPDLLEHALDNMSAADVPFIGEFKLLGPMERRGGGQGLVQFATQLRTSDPVAIKFFVNSRAFECERELYSQEHLRGMMPAVSLMHSNSDGTVVTDEGWRFPPFIVVERGESLDEWQAHVKPDFATVVQVLSHICERVKTLHDAGVAHRDLKPGNVLWRPKHYSWTLIDFGCAAKIGLISRLTFSVSYSPPETLMTLRSGGRSIKSDPATDIWAIGLIGYELIHRQRAFREFSWTFTDVLDAAAGVKAYPWEDRPGTFRRDPELRALGSVVRACLARDAAARPTAEQLVQKLNQLFDSHGTTMGPGTNTAEPSVPMPTADAIARTGSAGDMESADADAGSEPPVWDAHEPGVARGARGVRPPPGINAAVRSGRTYTHSRIELNSLQPSSVLAATAEVQDNGEFDAGLRRALAHAWGGASARLATTLEGNEATAETETTEPAVDGSDVPAVHLASSLQTSSALVTTADTGGGTSSAGTGTGGGGNPRGPVECAVSASGAESSVAVGASESNGEG